MNRLKVGVIGAGYWGPNLIRNFALCPQTEAFAVCDANPARLESIGRSYSSLVLVPSVDELRGKTVGGDEKNHGHGARGSARLAAAPLRTASTPAGAPVRISTRAASMSALSASATVSAGMMCSGSSVRTSVGRAAGSARRDTRIHLRRSWLLSTPEPAPASFATPGSFAGAASFGAPGESAASGATRAGGGGGGGGATGAGATRGAAAAGAFAGSSAIGRGARAPPRW